MPTNLNLDGVEAWTGGAVLGRGWHNIRCTEADDTQPSSGGHQQWILSLEAIDGPEAGGRIKDWQVITTNSAGKVRQILEAFQVPIPQGAFSFDVTELEGRHARIFVAEEPKANDPNQKVNKVQTYEVAEARAGAAPVGGNSSDPLAQAASAPSSTPPGDDDIPF